LGPVPDGVLAAAASESLFDRLSALLEVPDVVVLAGERPAAAASISRILVGVCVRLIVAGAVPPGGEGLVAAPLAQEAVLLVLVATGGGELRTGT